MTIEEKISKLKVAFDKLSYEDKLKVQKCSSISRILVLMTYVAIEVHQDEIKFIDKELNNYINNSLNKSSN